MTQVAFFLENFIVSVNKVLKIVCSVEGSCIGLCMVLLFSKVFFCRRLRIISKKGEDSITHKLENS